MVACRQGGHRKDPVTHPSRSESITEPEDETEIDYTDIFKDLGKNAPNRPISIYVTDQAKAILESANTGINQEYAKLVVK